MRDDGCLRVTCAKAETGRISRNWLKVPENYPKRPDDQGQEVSYEPYSAGFVLMKIIAK